MKITSIRSTVVVPPIRHAGYLGVGALERVENVLVWIETDDGITGIGEASPWPCFAENALSIKAAIDHYLRPALLGEDPFDVERLLQKMDLALHEYPFAKAALEMALFDIAGKAWGLPVYRLLGGKVRDRISLSYSIANQRIDADLAEIRWLLDQGFRVFKIKTGVLPMRDELRRLEAIREAVPGHVDLRVDYNQGLPREHAIRACRAVERCVEPTFIEQPVRGDDLEGMAEITRAIDTPILADESVFSLKQALRVVSIPAADLISIKLMKTGGIVGAKKIAGICQAAGMALYAGAMWESGIGIAAHLHFVASTPNVRYGSDFYIPNFLLEDDLIVKPLTIVAGDVLVPEGSGLGVEIDMDAVERRRLAA